MTGWETALAAVRKAVEDRKSPAIVAIDGRCGSGKTTLAAYLAERLDMQIVDTDDYYLPFDRRRSGWEKIPCANMDLDRLREEVLMPFAAGREALCRPYDCRQDVFGPARALRPEKPLLVEGSYSLHPSLAGLYRMGIFLTCSRQEQARRLRAREGERFGAFASTWIPLEEAYMETFGVARSALVIDTSSYPPPSEDGQAL